MGIETIATPQMWAGFTALILALLALDLGVFHRTSHDVGFKEALIWTLVWIGLAMLFNFGIYTWYGPKLGMEFLAGYLIEKALAVDNIFVFLVIFSSFGVPSQYQHRVLFWGILGALIMRAIFIALGAALLEQFHWTLYIFGGILLLTAAKLMKEVGHTVNPSANVAFRWFHKVVPSVPDFRGDAFVVRIEGRLYATPLLMVLILVELTDLVFAVDSIPAIFAVTKDPFIVYTSNIFAILGLRSMFFMLSGVVGRFKYLKVGLALVLAFVGIKMLLIDVYKIPIEISLGVVAMLLTGSILASLWATRNDPPEAPVETSSADHA